MYDRFNIIDLDDINTSQDIIDSFSESFASVGFGVSNEKVAKQTVKQMFETLNKWDIFRIYYNLKTGTLKELKDKLQKHKKTEQKRQSKKLGGTTHIENPYTYNLLMVADTVHDFNHPDLEYSEQVIEYIESKRTENILPNDLTNEVILNEDKFIKYMSKRDTLTFSNNKINNPLVGVDIDRYNINDKIKITENITYQDILQSKIASTLSKYNNLTRNQLPVDIMCKTDEILYGQGVPKTYKVQRLELKQLLYLVSNIRRWFNKEEFDFVIDGSDSLTKYIFGLKYINDEVRKQFMIDVDINRILKLSDLELTEQSWKVTKVDANFFDPNLSAVAEFDYRQTNNIYHGNQHFQIHINGINDVIPPELKQPKQFKPYTTATVTGLHFEKHEPITIQINVTDKVAEDVFSTKNIKQIVEVYQLLEEKNIPKMNTKSITSDIIKKNVSRLDRDTLFAIKRAGDWGQVEHCKKYNKTFVTTDRMAAMYAMYRRVPCILVRSKVVINKLFYSGLNNPPDFPNFAQLTFVLCK